MIDFGRANAELDDLFALAERSERSMNAYVGSLCESAIDDLRDRLERARRHRDTPRILLHDLARLWEQDSEARLKRWQWIQSEKMASKSDIDTYVSNLKELIPHVAEGELYAFLAIVRKTLSVPPGGVIPEARGTLTPIENETGPTAAK
jgi:alpha-amylase/alpha-mannosidase (GH57 family)